MPTIEFLVLVDMLLLMHFARVDDKGCIEVYEVREALTVLERSNAFQMHSCR